jgi:hypothetical protein
MESLVIPFVKFCSQNNSVFKGVAGVDKMKNAIHTLFEKCILADKCLKGANQKLVTDFLSAYLGLQTSMFKD